MNQAHPNLTVIIVTRPAEPLLGRAVLSALRQIGPSFEVVVVLDGICAQNRRVLARCADPRLRIIEHPKPMGRGAARARGVAEARGEWICSVDADDWLLPEKQWHQWNFIQQHPQLDLVAMGLLIVGRNGQLEGVRSEARFGKGLLNGQVPAIPTPSMMVRASVAKEVQYDASLWAGEDRDFLRRLLPGRAWAYLDAPHYAYEEYAAHSLRRCVESYYRRSTLDWRLGDTRTALRASVVNAGKALIAVGAFTVGQGDALVRRRSSAPTPACIERYEEARTALDDALREKGLLR